MADIADISQAESEFLLSLKLSTRMPFQGESADYCCECGEEIPAERRKALPGIRYCVFCAEHFEKTGIRI